MADFKNINKIMQLVFQGDKAIQIRGLDGFIHVGII